MYIKISYKFHIFPGGHSRLFSVAVYTDFTVYYLFNVFLAYSILQSEIMATHSIENKLDWIAINTRPPLDPLSFLNIV